MEKPRKLVLLSSVKWPGDTLCGGCSVCTATGMHVLAWLWRWSGQFFQGGNSARVCTAFILVFHLAIVVIDLCQDSGFPLCQEDEDTTLHLIAHCSALMLLQKNILGEYTLSLSGLFEKYPLVSPLEVCQSFQEVLSTLWSVRVAHWAGAVVSALDVCLQ